MNVVSMKLESTESKVGTSSKCKYRSGRKCKNNRKKINPFDFDRESLRSSDGLGRESNSAADFDSRSSPKIEFIFNKRRRSKRTSDDGKMLTKTEMLQDRLHHSINEETRKRISQILSDIRNLSDVAKLLLYLQLPTGSTVEDDPLKQKGQSNPLGKKADEEGTLAVTWIQSHLEEDAEVSLPKQEVYDEYQSYCEMIGNEALCAADFGKVMKQIFPSVKPRRLGTRGNSRYCYSGLRKKHEVDLPHLPDLDVKKENCKLQAESKEMDDVLTAACHVLFEWAEKLLGNSFTSLKALAAHLIENMFVDNRSVAAFTVLLASSPEHLDKTSVESEKCESKGRKTDTQIHLQRKIQEKELIRGQKQKMQEQRSYLVTACSGKSVQARKKSFRNRKTRMARAKSLSNGQILKVKVKDGCDHSEIGSDLKINSDSDSSGKTSEVNNSGDGNEFGYIFGSYADGSEKNLSAQFARLPHSNRCFFPCVPHKPNSSGLLVSEKRSWKKKTKSKIAVSNDSTPVCISQSIPGFIIVPSLSQVHLTETTNKSNSKGAPKYKRIQPKPLNELPSQSTMRYRTGSLGSAVFKEGRSRTDGRRSSLALLHSSSNKDYIEDDKSTNSKRSKSFVNNGSVNKTSCDNLIKTEIQDSCEINFQKNPASSVHDQAVMSSGHHSRDNIIDEITGTKRHSEDLESQGITKKLHLDDVISSEVSSESLSSWTKDVSNMNCSISSNFLPSDNSEIANDTNTYKEEVSIHELESDALIDSLHGAHIETHSDTWNKKTNRLLQAETFHLNELPDDSERSSEITNVEVSNASNPEVSQLSQLRILLEQNLPHTVSKGNRSQAEQNVRKKPSVLMHTNDLTVSQGESISKNKNCFLNRSEMSSVFLRNINPYMNSEFSVLSGRNLPVNQNHADNCLSTSVDVLSQGTITEKDLLTVMADPLPAFTKNNSLIVSHSNRVLQDQSGTLNGMPTLSNIEQFNPSNVEHSSTQTQILSVPPSPNTRRRAFNFMPISPRHTPVSDGNCISVSSGSQTCYSPIPLQHSVNLVSVGVGPSQPPSNAGSPFVSPRSTPVPPSRSRHSSGQSTYSASRHTPFQNFDSGVSSISSSPFISPQPTPVPLSRLRHNSSHGPCKTVTFSTVNNSQIIHTLSSVIGHSSGRLRHSSGSAGSHVGFSLLSPRSAPLSPLVNENAFSNFSLPSTNESRSRHSSGLEATTLSPVSEVISPTGSCSSSSQPTDISAAFQSSHAISDQFINANSSKELTGLYAGFKQTRHRHASSSVIYTKPSMMDSLAEEVQLFLKNGSDSLTPDSNTGNRSRSVPLHQMLHNLANNNTAFQSPDELKSFATVISSTRQGASFPVLVTNSTSTGKHISSDSLIVQCDKSLQSVHSEWPTLDNSSDVTMSAVRKNLSSLLDPPLGDDLQTTLEDLRDCDTDFSKLAQELEQLGQNEDGGL